MLHQLDCPLGLETERDASKTRALSQSNRMRNIVGNQALVISNKQEIKPTLKSERKSITAISNHDFLQNVENKRPPSSFKGKQGPSPYQKIKRPFGNP